MNILIVLVFYGVMAGLLFLVNKRWEKAGLFAFAALNTVMANLFVSSPIELFGVPVNIFGATCFAMNFLITDILYEKYGKAVALRGAEIAIFAEVFYLILSQLFLLTSPLPGDTIRPALQLILGASARATCASLLCFAVANITDVHLFGKIRGITKGRFLALRTIIATIVCNCGENILFAFLVFIGVLPISAIWTWILTNSILEAIITGLNTPILYLILGKKLKLE